MTKKRQRKNVNVNNRMYIKRLVKRHASIEQFAKET